MLGSSPSHFKERLFQTFPISSISLPEEKLTPSMPAAPALAVLTQQPLSALGPTEHPQDFHRQRHSKASHISQQMYRREGIKQSALGSHKDTHQGNLKEATRAKTWCKIPPLLFQMGLTASDPILSLNQPLTSVIGTSYSKKDQVPSVPTLRLEPRPKGC